MHACVIVSGLMSLFNNYSVISRQCPIVMLIFISAASLKNHAPDSLHDTQSSHITLTLG